MTDDETKAIESMRERYLNQYRYIVKKDNRITFFEEIGETGHED